MLKSTKKKVVKGWSKELPKYQLARWMALYEGINIIADKAEDRKIDFKDVSLHIPELKRYIDTTAETISKVI